MTKEEIKAAIAALAEGNGEAALKILESLMMSMGEGDAAADPAAPPAAAGATGGNAEEPPPEMAALARGVLALFSGLDAASALKAIEALKAGSDKAAADAAVLESVERRALVGELVKLGVEVPATAWVDPDKTGAELAPVERLAKEELPALRKRVSIIKTTRGALKKDGHTPPPAADGLSDAERAMAEKITDPVKRARFIELRASRRKAV
jgi:hypothetical protein